MRFHLECFEPPSPQINYKTQSHFDPTTMGINETEYEHFKHVPALQNWIRTQPHLPQNIGEFIASRIFISAFVFIFHLKLKIKKQFASEHFNASAIRLDNFYCCLSILGAPTHYYLLFLTKTLNKLC